MGLGYKSVVSKWHLNAKSKKKPLFMPAHWMMLLPCHYNLTYVFTRYAGFENGSTDSETEQTPKRRPESRPLPISATLPSLPPPPLCKFWFDCQLQQCTVQWFVPLQYFDSRLSLYPKADIAVNMGQESLNNIGQKNLGQLTYTDISWNVRRESDPFNGRNHTL